MNYKQTNSPLYVDRSPLSTLPLVARVLYADITALSSKTGVCYATNGFFAKQYGVSTRTVSKYLGVLKALELIEVSHTSAKIGGIRVMRPKKKATPPDVERSNLVSAITAWS
ncbi:MAG: helix-turn-helix domain-containing protein [Clostridia bacterium]|nr:helix-turn-helix domain-containing protein [Clostridia bacterium]